jgi:hypothetical protein
VDRAQSRGDEFVDIWLDSSSRELAFARKARFVPRELAHRIVVYPSQDVADEERIGKVEWRF